MRAAILEKSPYGIAYVVGMAMLEMELVRLMTKVRL
jgi:hypothetical protein